MLHGIDKIDLLDIDVESRQCCNKTEIISVITGYPYNLAYTTPANLIFVRTPLGWVSQ